MDRIINIINRLSTWMNYSPDENSLLDSSNTFKIICQNDDIHIYHNQTKNLVAIIKSDLKYYMQPPDYYTLEFKQFELLQYVNSLLIRILSTV
jgi:hypothetical protein